MELAGTEVPVIWRGRRIHAFVPTLLADRDLSLNNVAANRCGAAGLSVAHGAEALPDDYAPLARLLLRAGVLTSYGTASVTGRGRPAALYVSEDLLGLAGSGPIRR